MTQRRNKQHLVNINEIILLAVKPKHIIFNFEKKRFIRSVLTSEGVMFDLMPTILPIQKHKYHLIK